MKRVLVFLILICMIFTGCSSMQTKNNVSVVKSTSEKTTNKQNQSKSNIENKKENINNEEATEEKGHNEKENTKKHAADEIKDNEESSDIYNLSEKNPIDLDYDIEYEILREPGNYTDQAYDKFKRKYFEIWDTELNAIYNKLLAVLEGEEKQLLIESQKGWLQFHLNDPKFVFKTFRERETGSIMGTVVCTHLYNVKYRRIRTRTLELMEYYYLLGNGIDFEYKRQFEDKELNKKSGDESDNDGNDNHKIYTHYDTGGQYYQVSYDNPINHDYEIELERINNSQDYSTHMVLQFQYKYYEIWDKELNTIYNKLVKELNEEEKELLLQAQLGWVQFHMNENKFFQKIFYERESGPILGTLGQIQMLDSRMERIKSRTIELMEYYYYLVRDGFDFEYESEM